jgi:hypothetical protein
MVTRTNLLTAIGNVILNATKSALNRKRWMGADHVSSQRTTFAF